MITDQAMLRQIEEERAKLPGSGGDFSRFLAYTHDDGPDDVEQEPERRGIRKLKGTPVWPLLYPARKGYRAARFLYQNGVSGIYQKAESAVENNRYKRRKEARKYLTQLLPTEEEKEKQSKRAFQKKIKISVLVPLYNTPEKFLRDMIESVTGQTYPDWELCLADASDAGCKYVSAVVSEYAAKDKRIVYQKLARNGGISENTNACIGMASGNYLALFDHDDMLHPSALYECAKEIEREGADFVYTDEVTFEGDDLENIQTYHFKPDFSVDNLRGVNYICHLSVFSKELLDRAGAFRAEFDGSQDHDMIMRLTDAADKVCHIPKTLYFWRCHSLSTSMNLNAKPYAVAAGRQAVAEAEERRGFPAEVHSAQICKTHYRLKYRIGEPKVAVLIDGCGQGSEQAARTAAGVSEASAYSAYELFYASSQERLKELIFDADGEYLLVLAAGTVPLTPSFMEELLMFAQRPDVGIAGMQVLDEKDLILSSDIVIGNTAGLLAIEANRGIRYDAPGYMGRNYYAHDVSAVSACAFMSKKEDLAGLWAKCGAKSSFGRVLEACFLLRQQGRQIVLNPYALCRRKSAEYAGELPEADRQMIAATYREQILKGDPFYNENLSFERHWKKK